MDSEFEYQEWMRSKHTRAATDRFRQEARATFERLMQACQDSPDQGVQLLYRAHLQQLTMIRLLTGKAAKPFDFVEGEDGTKHTT